MPNQIVTPTIRPVSGEDVDALKTIIDATDMFPPAMLDDMISGFLQGQTQDEIWLTYDDGQPQAIAFCRPEEMADRLWNLLLIAVSPDRHGAGIGTALMQHVEERLRDDNQRILIVETSGTPAMARTRRFYDHLGYAEEARIRDFYEAGDDKIVFWKKLE